MLYSGMLYSGNRAEPEIAQETAWRRRRTARPGNLVERWFALLSNRGMSPSRGEAIHALHVQSHVLRDSLGHIGGGLLDNRGAPGSRRQLERRTLAAIPERDERSHEDTRPTGRSR
jgi:hypothetical protein